MDQTERVIEWKARVFHCGQLSEQISPYIKLHRGKGVAQHSHPLFLARTLTGKEYMPPGKQTVTDDRQGSTGRRVEAARTGHSRESSERSSSRISNQSSIRGGPATAWSGKLMMVVNRFVLRVRSPFSEG